MLTNVDQVESYFSNPENVHKLYVYEVVDFNNNIESIISENTNNFLKIKLIGVKRGIYESCSFSPQVKVMGANNDIGVKINTDLVFISNDDFSFLERTKKLYVFTINEEFINDQDIYIITDNSIKAMNELSDEDLDKIKLDDADNLINLYSIGLQNIKKLEVGKNSTINFKLVDDLPDFSSGENKIISITYTLPINSLVQSIQLIGSIYNKNLNKTLQNEQLDLKLDNNEIGLLPIFVKLKNINQKAFFDILNFFVNKQLPLYLFKENIIGKNKKIENIFKEFIDDNGNLPQSINDLVILFKKLIIYTWAFVNDFSFFNKQDEKFVNYYNATYANKKISDFNTQQIFQYEKKYPEMTESIPYQIFKGLCYMSSNIIVSPFGVEKDKLSDAHKDYLWFYLEIPFDADYISKNFNSDGSLKSSLLDFSFGVNSKYFTILNDNGNISIKNKINEINIIRNGIFLPSSTINKIDEEYYQCYLFFKNKKDCFEIINNYFISDWQEKEKTLSLDSPNNYPNPEELKKLLPPDAIEIWYDPNAVNQEIVNGSEKILEECPKSLQHSDRFTSSQLFDCDDNYCYYRVKSYSPPYGPGGGNSSTTIYKTPRKFHYNTVYRTTVTFKFKTRMNFITSDYCLSSSNIFNFLYEKNEFKNDFVDLKFILNKNLSKNGWEISNIKEDYCFGFMNSPTKMTINYLDQENNEKSFIYEIKNSFQKIDNCNALTRNKY